VEHYLPAEAGNRFGIGQAVLPGMPHSPTGTVLGRAEDVWVAKMCLRHRDPGIRIRKVQAVPGLV
jgi:hypothetical protein